MGIGHTELTCTPSKVLLDGKVSQIAGGEHHTIALTSEGKVYCWGRNDESQCGLGDLYDSHRREKAQKEYEAEMKAAEEAQNAQNAE